SGSFVPPPHLLLAWGVLVHALRPPLYCLPLFGVACIGPPARPHRTHTQHFPPLILTPLTRDLLVWRPSPSPTLQCTALNCTALLCSALHT
ncbi:hypothetical protein B0J11DRAFT_514568, partial [Dendryphion nanum]